MRRLSTVFIAVLCFVMHKSHAQYTFKWLKMTNPSSATQHGLGEDLAITPQGKIAINGESDSGSHLGAMLISYDTSGNRLWSRRFEGVVEAFSSRLFLTPSGQWLTAGYFEDASGTHDVFYNTYSQAGDSVSGGWQHTPGFASSDEFKDAAIDSRGNVYLGGSGRYPNAQGTLTRFDTGGRLRWTAAVPYFTGTTNLVKAVAMSGDRRIITALQNTTGYSTIACHDSAGVLQWRRDSLVYAPEFHTALTTDAAGAAITGGRFTKGYRLVKINSATGDTIWTRNLAHPGVNGTFGTIHHVLTDAANTIYAFGTSNTHSLLAAVSSSGTVLWTDTLRNGAGGSFAANAEYVHIQDGIITLVLPGFNPRIYQYNVSGTKLSDTAFSLPGLYYPEVSAMQYFNGDLYITGSSSMAAGGGGSFRRGYIARLKMKARPSTSIVNVIGMKRLLLYPNPATQEITVACAAGHTIAIADGAGRICLQQQAAGNSVDVHMLPPGTYSVWVMDSNGAISATGQFVKR